MNEQQLLEKLEEIIKWKKSRKFYAEKLGVSEERLDGLMEKIKEKEAPPTEVEVKNEETVYQHNFEKEEILVSKLWQCAPSPEEVIKAHSIDETKWKISQIWIKQSTKGFLTSASFTPKKTSDMSPEEMGNILSKYKSTFKPLSKSDLIINNKWTREHSMFIDLTDFHLDRKELSGKTTEEKINDYYKIIDKLLYRAYSSHRLEEIVFVVGSDMFNTDTFTGTTTAGTPQTSNMDWDKAYETAFDIYTNVINKLKQFCISLKVILIQGNHDRTKSFYMAYALKRYFEQDSTITFDTETKPRKIHIYGSTFIGLHHGNTKLEDLPLTFAQEFSTQWGPAKFKAIMVGDKHYYMEKEIKGVRIKQIPALCGPDLWSNDHNYIGNIRAGLATIYDKELGRVCELEERI